MLENIGFSNIQNFLRKILNKLKPFLRAMNRKTKTAGVVFIIALLLLIGYLFWPAAEPEDIISDWVDSGAIITVGDQEISVDNAEISDDFTHVIIYDSEGNVIAVIPIDELNDLIQNTPPNQPVLIPSKYMPAPPPPAPVPVPVPIPTPPPINITNITPSPTPTPTPPNVTPPTPTPPAVCGNNIVESGEQCEPPNTATCDANCQNTSALPGPGIPTYCGNQAWDGDESDFNCGGSCPACAPLPPYCDNLNYPSPYNIPCAQHLSCWTNSDCVTNNCDLSGATPLPAIDPNTGTIYNLVSQIRLLAGQTWIIPYSGICK